MYLFRITLLTLTLSVLASCSTIIELPMHPVVGEARDHKSPVKLLVAWDNDLQPQSYSTSQLASTWIYPLGRVIPEMTIESLSEFFEVVDISDQNDESRYDFSVSVKMLGFSAEVPSTIFSPTETVVELEYTLRNISSGKTYTLNALSNQEAVTPRDKYIYDNLTKEVKDLFAYASGVVVTAPKYEYLAARDGMMAISKCTYDLARQVDSLVSNSLITSKASRRINARLL